MDFVSEKLASAGGAYVRRQFTLGEREMRAGDVLTAEQLAAIPPVNARSLINIGKIELFPKSPVAPNAQRYVRNLGFGKFDVIEGVKLNAEPLGKDEAAALAGEGAATH